MLIQIFTSCVVSMVQLGNLLNNLRSQQTECLAIELFEVAREVQRAIDNVRDAQEPGTGLASDLLFQVRNTFQRVFRKARNRLEEWLSQVYKFYVEDMQELLKWETKERFVSQSNLVKIWDGVPGNPKCRGMPGNPKIEQSRSQTRSKAWRVKVVPWATNAHETKEECKILWTLLSVRMTRTNRDVRTLSHVFICMENPWTSGIRPKICGQNSERRTALH